MTQLSNPGAAYIFDLGGDPDDDGVPDLSDQCPNTVPGVTVDASGCPPIIPGGCDRDGDVDAADTDQFQACSIGPGIPQNDPACEKASLDGDDAVDQVDFGFLQRCYREENVPGSPNCAD